MDLDSRAEHFQNVGLTSLMVALQHADRKRFGWFTTSDGSRYIICEDLAREGLVAEREHIFVHVEQVQDGPTFWQFLTVIVVIVAACLFSAWVFLRQC